MPQNEKTPTIDDTIILIGPMNVGKSTTATLLAEKLDMPRIPMDTIRFDYYKEIGYSEEKAKALIDSGDYKGLLHYWKPFEAHAVERILADHQHCVIDFGAGHSVYDDDTLFARVEKALAPYKHVILLLPSPDLDQSVQILKARFTLDVEDMDIYDYFVKHPSNPKLAKATVYTDSKTPEQTCEDIIKLVKVT